MALSNMATAQAHILWRRLDAPGHDACRLTTSATSPRLGGTALFGANGVPACLTYRVVCDAAWNTREGRVDGWIGAQAIAYHITRSVGNIWTLNGAQVAGLDDCVDLDLGFTPATNLVQLRRVALEPKQGVDVPVAWLDVSNWQLQRLEQRYERRSETRYWYTAPRFDYAAFLDVDANGFVRNYPDLWEAEVTG